MKKDLVLGDGPPSPVAFMTPTVAADVGAGDVSMELTFADAASPFDPRFRIIVKIQLNSDRNF